MNNYLFSIISDILKDTLQHTVVVGSRDNLIANPEEFNLCRTRVTASCLGVIAYQKISAVLGQDRNDNSIRDMVYSLNKILGGSSKFLDYYMQLNDYENQCLENRRDNIASINYVGISLMDIYESLLSLEFYLDKGEIVCRGGKSHRNRLGLYYTPDNLATACVTYTLDSFINSRLNMTNFSSESHSIPQTKWFDLIELFKATKVADFSCGTGKFLVAFAQYLKKHIIEDPRTTQKKKLMRDYIRNIYGIDVDHLALEIAKIELTLISGDFDSFPELGSNFLHGNPLIPPFLSMFPSEKEETYGKGYLYNECLGLGLDPSEFEFDIIIGNPPWEKIRFEEKSFFSSLFPQIYTLSNKNDRLDVIDTVIKNNSQLYHFYVTTRRDIEKFKRGVKKEDRFSLSAHGEFNTYALFTELALNHRSRNGIIGLILKSSIATSQVNKRLFSHLLDNGLIISIFDFINAEKIFDIDSRERFSFLLLGNQKGSRFLVAMGLTSPNDMFRKEDIHSLDINILKRINPDTVMLPNITNKEQLELLTQIANVNPMFSQVYNRAKFGRIVHFTNHASFIQTTNSDSVLPIYEGKFIEQYDGRYSGFNHVEYRERYGNKVSAKVISEEEKEDPTFTPEARFYIQLIKWRELTKGYKQPYSLMWRSLTSATNRRTCIATILPHMPTSQSIQLIQLDSNKDLGILLSVFNSVVFDYMIRAKLNGIDLTQSIIRQIPVPPLERYQEKLNYDGKFASLEKHISVRVARLLGDDSRLTDFIAELTEFDSNLYQDVKQLDRKITQLQIDLLVARAYRLKWDAFNRIIFHFNKFYSNRELVLFKEKLPFLS